MEVIDEDLREEKLLLRKLPRGHRHSRCYVEVSAGGSSVKGEPALVVGLVDAGSVLHQESHHVDVVVYARLRRERIDGM